MSFEGLTYREDYARDLTIRDAIDRLLMEVFEFELRHLEDFEGWDPSYRPFSYFDESGEVVANVACLDMKLTLDGRTVDAIGVQSVVTRPEWRRRGLFRDLMRRALAWADARSPTILLLTTSPGLYLPLGFRPCPQSRFFGRAPAPEGIADPGARSLALDQPADRRLLLDLFRRRAPVSSVFGLHDFRTMFAYCAPQLPQMRLHYLPRLDLVVALEPTTNGGLRLLDLIGPRIPRLGEILGALGPAIESPRDIECGFVPDKLGWRAEARLHAPDLPLMARGAFLGPDRPFCLPPTAEF